MVNINPVIWNEFNESSITFSATSIVESNNFETPIIINDGIDESNMIANQSIIGKKIAQNGGKFKIH